MGEMLFTRLCRDEPKLDRLSAYSLGPRCNRPVRIRGKALPAPGHENFLVGRSCHVHSSGCRYADKFFKRLHFMIETNPPCCRLFDMNSTNGTSVNGNRVTGIDLHEGDLIQGGDTRYQGLAGRRLGRSPQNGRFRLNRAQGGGRPGRCENTETYRSCPGSCAPTATECLPPEPCRTSSNLPIIDGYRMLKELGRGGMGVVYLAVSELDRRPVAIKTLRPAVVVSSQEAKDRFLREAAILQNVAPSKDRPGSRAAARPPICSTS